MVRTIIAIFFILISVNAFTFLSFGNGKLFTSNLVERALVRPIQYSSKNSFPDQFSYEDRNIAVYNSNQDSGKSNNPLETITRAGLAGILAIGSEHNNFNSPLYEL